MLSVDWFVSAAAAACHRTSETPVLESRRVAKIVVTPDN